MKFKNSQVPCMLRRDSDRAIEMGDVARRKWFDSDTFDRFLARREKLLARKDALRRANRGYRRRNGLTLKYA